MEENMQVRVSTAKACFSRMGAALVVMAIAVTVVQVILLIFVNVLAQMGVAMAQATWVSWLVTFLPVYGVGVPLALGILKKLPADQGERTTLGAGRFVSLVLMCFPIMYIGNVVGNVASSLLSSGQAENALVDMVSEINVWKALVLAVVAPIVEEFLFRKQLIDRCVRYGEKTAILFSALTFALFHMNLFQFFYAFGLGLLLAYAYVRTRSLRYPIVMHMVVNFTGSVLAPLVLSQVDVEALSNLNPQAIDETALAQVLPGLMIYMGYMLLYLVVVIVGLVLLIVKRKKLVFMPAAEELPKEERLRTVYGNVGVIVFVALCVLMIVGNLIPMM